ncbi:hypothetical protein N183_24380 [Sinorhizobium sp. Sb3]|nr:hypothetical protein N183_24380 [Sinorhizobium sp. Sb3]
MLYFSEEAAIEKISARPKALSLQRDTKELALQRTEDLRT